MRKLLVCSSSALLGLCGATATWAQSGAIGAEAGDLTLEEIVVTAEKRETDLQKTAISIQVYSGDQLKKEGKKRIDEIMNGVVGVQTQGSQVGSSFYMRGVESGGGGPPGGGPNQTAVAVLIDGIYQNRGEAVRGGTLDLKQAEVMRGTQSTNLGGSSLSGAVSLVSNNPIFEYQANGSLEVGNYHLLNTEGVLNIPLASNQALRFAYSTNQRDGYISSGAGDSDLTNARLKYRFQASDNLDVVATVSHQSIGGNGVSDGVLLYSGHWEPWANQVTMTQCAPPNGTTTMGCPPLFVVVSDGITYKDRANPWDDGYPKDAWPNNPFRDTNIDSYSAEVNANLGFGTLTLTPSIQRAHFRSSEPPRGTSWREQNQKQNTEQMEARLASADGSRLQWLGGLYYYYTDQPGTFHTLIFPGASGMDSCANTVAQGFCSNWADTKESSQRTLSAYGNVTYPVIDTLRLIGGVRYTKDTKVISTTADTAGTMTGPSSVYTYTSGSADWNATTYRGGIEYDLAPQSMLYTSYSTGYQPGSLNADTAGGTTSSTKKLELEQITLGIKNRFFDNRLQVNVEAFNSQYHNRTLQGSLSTSYTTPDNNCNAAPGSSATVVYISSTTACINNPASIVVPDLLSRGVDLEVSYLPTADDRLDTSVEYLRSYYNSTPDTRTYTASDLLALNSNTGTASASLAATLASQYSALISSYQGLTLQNSPKWSVNATYRHDFSLPGGSKLTPKINGIYKTRYWTQGGGPGANAANPGNSYQETYHLYNAYLTWEASDGKFNINGYVKNLKNKPIMTNYGTTYVTLDAPRTYGVSFNASF